MCLSRVRLLTLCSLQEWVARARLIRCPAPLPETALEPVLVRMLEVVPAEGGNGENRGANISPKGATEEEGTKNPSLQGDKRTAFEDPEAKAPKRGKRSSPGGPAPGKNPDAQSSPKDRPSSEP